MCCDWCCTCNSFCSLYKLTKIVRAELVRPATTPQDTVITEVAQEPVIAPKQAVIAPQQATGCDLVNQYDWDTKLAFAICQAESRGNVNAVNWADGHSGCKGSFGLMQLACVHGVDQNTTPEQNMAIAYALYKRSGWKIWGAYTDKNYLRFM